MKVLSGFELDKQNRFAKNSECSKEKDPKIFWIWVSFYENEKSFN